MSSLSIVSLLTRFLTAMAFISETSDDDHPAKKPQEVITQKNRSVSSAIPNDLINICVAMVPRSHYPKMSLFSKQFHSLVTSPELYKTRSLLKTTESFLYGFISFPPFEFPRCYILHRNHNQLSSLRLSIITSLPPINLGSAVVTIGHNMYVMGGFDGERKRTSDVILIDCTTHQRLLLPSMGRVRYRAAAGVIDGKIYVIGGREKSYPDWVEVFDVKTKSWSFVPGPYPLGAQKGEFESYVVMKDKIYLLDYDSCFSYQPRTQSWDLCVRLRDFWHVSSCVVDDMLYTIDLMCVLGSLVIVYDPEKQDWRAVNGVVVGLPSLFYYESRMTNFDGRLVILGVDSWLPFCERNIWCVKIALERSEESEISGKMESRTIVFTSMKSPTIELCRTVTV